MPACGRRKKHAWIYIVVIGGLVSVGLFFLGRYTARECNASTDRNGYRVPCEINSGSAF